MVKVKLKVIAITFFSVVILGILTSVIFGYSYFGYINQNKYKELEKEYGAIEYVIENEKNDLSSILGDWANWDDSYEFVNNLDEKYINSNIDDDVFINYNLKSIIYFNNEGKVIFDSKYEIDKEEIQKILIKSGSVDNKTSKTGMLLLDDKLYMVAITPITLTKDKSKSNGSLMFVRQFDKQLLEYIENVTKVTLGFKEVAETDSLANIDSNAKINLYNDTKIFAVDRIVKDLNNEDSIIFELKTQEDDKMFRFSKLFVIEFLILVAVIVWVDLKICNKFILNRLLKLSKFIESITETKDTTLRIDMSGKDEIYELAKATNNMLSELDLANSDMKKMDEIFKIIMEATNDGYSDIDIKKEELYISLEWRNIIGYKNSDGYETVESYLTKVHPECKERLKSKYLAVIKGEVEYFGEEYRIIKESGDIIWVQQKGKVVEKDEKGNPIRIVSTLADITDRKKYEEEILFLSYSDKLTGLRNRTFMEREFGILDENNESNYFIIMGDINGLKLVNDTAGYKEGDNILIRVSEIIKEIFEDDSIISRWGGDEFVIIVRDKDEDYISELFDKIKEFCWTTEEFSISMAWGYAKWSEESMNSESVMNLAEMRMYRNKLLDNNSARSATINSLLRTLYEKHNETQQHTMRIRNLSFKLGKRLGFRKEKLDELDLLSALHDIGKIGIPDQILSKPGKLTSEEWIIMKSHSEVGYRIANSTPELAHISDKILAHHEKFDGTGYPNGLKGEEIPLLSRIINIVDAFDVMTHRRAYKEAFDKDYVLEELKKCAGGQFDPVLVGEFLKLLEEDGYIESN